MTSSRNKFLPNDLQVAARKPPLGGPPVESGFAEALTFLRQNMKGVVLAAVVGGAAAAYVAVTLDPLYRSEAQLFVPPSFSSPLEDQGGLQARAEASYLDSQIYIIQSPDLLLQVIEQQALSDHPSFSPEAPGFFDEVRDLVRALLPTRAEDVPASAMPDDDEREAQRVLRQLRKMIEVSRRGSSYVISITALAPQPSLATDLANTVAAAYIDQTLQRRSDEFRQNAEWLSDQAFELQSRLHSAETAVEDFRSRHSLLGGEPGSTLNQQQLTEINVELIRTRAALAERQAALDIAEQQAVDDVYALAIPESLNSLVMNGLRTQLLDAQRERAATAERLASTQRLGFLDADIAELEEQIRSEVARIIRSLRSDVRTLETKERLLQSELESVSGQTQIDQRVMVELRALEREAATLQDLYSRYLLRSQITQETANFSGSAPRVVGRAMNPVEPVFPPKKVFVVFGILLGGGLVIVLSLLRAGFGRSFASAEDLSAWAAYPVVGTLPRARRGRGRAAAKARADVTQAARAIRLRLAPDLADVRAPLVLISDGARDAGSEALLLALAESGSNAGKRVLIVRVASSHGAAPDPLRHSRPAQEQAAAWVARPLGSDGATSPRISLLEVPAPTTEVPLPVESAEFSRTVGKARDQFDLILTHAPAIARSQDAIYLARLADIVVLAVRHKATTKSELREALVALGDSRVRLVMTQ